MTERLQPTDLRSSVCGDLAAARTGDDGMQVKFDEDEDLCSECGSDRCMRLARNMGVCCGCLDEAHLCRKCRASKQ